MMIKYYPFLFFFFIITSINAQSGCFNSDFSNADFNGWKASYGTRSNPNLHKGENFKHHFITNIDVKDSIAGLCGGELFMVPPGEVHAARLGNNLGGTEADRLIYDINVVSKDNNLFIYKYAVVLEDGGHEKEAQPNFSVRILNDKGSEIDPRCGVYNVSSGEPYQNANVCGDIYWTQWNTVGINLANYMGKKVSIEFTTRDCSFVKHFGYAYISAKCSQLKINVAVCSGGNNFTLTAPVGFIGYSWTYKGQVVGTPTQSITLALADYPPGATFECLLTSFNNGNTCESTIEATLSNPTVITPNYSVSIPCKVDYNTFSPITFQDKTTILNGVINKWEWDFGDGKTSTEKNPSHIFENSGDYTVSLTVYSVTGCSQFISKPIHVENNPIAKPAVSEIQTLCYYPVPTLANLDTNGLTVKWFDSLLSTEAVSETTKIISNRDIYCAIFKDGCLGPRTKISIIINAIGHPIGEATQSFCSSEAPTIANLKVNGLAVTWYNAQDGGNLISDSTPLQNNVTYYASDYDASIGCSSTRWGITAILKEGSAVISPDFTQEFCSNEDFTLKNLNYYNSSVRYYSNINDTAKLPHTTPLESGATYYAAIIDPVTKCESNKRTAITVNIKPCDINIYNLITIDENTQNDHLEIENIEYFPENAIQVYNRFGQLVYKMSGYGVDSNYFYGRANAGEVFLKDEKLPTGSYYYIINYKKRDQTDATKKGFLYIHNNG
ncbi:gliding motility-associated C-terminal domain-containing protein [Flavobacterium sp. LC2016-12]|uniref:T9SS type B sorting domain-containing protein n=1 Tax=Flavobacterium sp. LC2016-12 TaxID=2783794 RepID=UPI00188D6F18|nr:gliding motility-associated C-terminal domain-containing protein [Flavobacterium sp. LC2016-12]MBF4464385.1 gliding motility-associated C-terminal domain-containing protein [Flavobacterium sp. LC2016-12]